MLSLVSVERNIVIVTAVVVVISIVPGMSGPLVSLLSEVLQDMQQA